MTTTCQCITNWEESTTCTFKAGDSVMVNLYRILIMAKEGLYGAQDLKHGGKHTLLTRAVIRFAFPH